MGRAARMLEGGGEGAHQHERKRRTALPTMSAAIQNGDTDSNATADSTTVFRAIAPATRPR